MHLRAAELSAAVDAVARLAAARTDREACGLVLRARDGSLRALELPNDADRWAAADPARFPGGARRGFVLAPRALREALGDAAAMGAVLHAVWHSHVGAPAAPSPRDVQGAFDDGGAPILPGVEWWIVPVWVQPGGARAGRTRRFRCAGGQFEELHPASGPGDESD